MEVKNRYKENYIIFNMKYFIENIELNNLNVFFDGNNENKDYYLNDNFDYFKNKLNGFYTFITECGTTEPKYLEEVIFLSKYIDLIFKEAKKENGILLSVFKNEEEKNKFYELLPQYFGGNTHNKTMEIRQHTPGFTKEDDERLAQEARQKLEEEKIIQEEKDKQTIEDIRGKILTDEEEKAILSIFDEK